MFEQMANELRLGIFPEKKLLRKRFAAALVKKLAVIRTPYSFWPADTKINPPAKQLLWAATLLQDKENFSVVEAIISSEVEEQLRAKGKPVNFQVLSEQVRQLQQKYMQEFVELAPNEEIKEILRQFVNELHPLTEA